MSEVKLPQDFSEYWYLKYNPDVEKAVNEGIVPSGAEHYLYNGHKENREYSEPSVTVSDFHSMVLRVETTNHCNFKCSFCTHANMTRPKGYMTDELYEKIITEARELGFANLDLRNFGEPLIDKTLHNKTKLAKDIGFNYILIHTNGYFLDSECFETLVDSGMDTIIVSLSPKTEFENTRGMYFDRIFDNLYAISNSLNKNKIVIDFINTGNSSAQEINEFYNDIKNFGYQIREEVQLHNWAHGELTANQILEPCHRLWSSITILHNGQISLCCLDYEGKINLGNVNDKSILELINSDMYKVFRKMHLDGDLPSMCRVCNMQLKDTK